MRAARTLASRETEFCSGRGRDRAGQDELQRSRLTAPFPGSRSAPQRCWRDLLRSRDAHFDAVPCGLAMRGYPGCVPSGTTDRDDLLDRRWISWMATPCCASAEAPEVYSFELVGTEVAYE